MNEYWRSGYIKVFAGTTALLITAILLIPVSNISKTVIIYAIVAAVLSMFLSILGIMDFGKAITFAKMNGKQEKAGVLMTPDDLRKAFKAELVKFVAMKIYPITDNEGHHCSSLVKIEIYEISPFTREKINIKNTTRTIRTGQNLIIGTKYIVDESGIERPITSKEN